MKALIFRILNGRIYYYYEEVDLRYKFKMFDL